MALSDLKAAALAAIDALNADDSVSREEMRGHLADLSNHIDDHMRAIDAEEERAEARARESRD